RYRKGDLSQVRRRSSAPWRRQGAVHVDRHRTRRLLQHHHGTDRPQTASGRHTLDRYRGEVRRGRLRFFAAQRAVGGRPRVCPPSPLSTRVQDALWEATEAGVAAAVPGNTAADFFQAQAAVLEARGLSMGNVGRFGHGLGKVMTEFPSNKPIDRTPLRPGMVLTIEPSATYGA